jgi:two-component system, cell cycle sensor histidine kinase and response regulator CckA
MTNDPVGLAALLVEDSPSDALVAKLYLEAELGQSCKVIHVQHISNALTALQSVAFSVILLDLGLPDSQGMDSLRQIVSAAPRTPVVVLTRDGDLEFARETIKQGAQDYLVKGRFDAELLCRTVRYSIDRQKLRAELEDQAEQLRVATRRAYFIADQNVDGMLVVDPQGHVLYANPTAQRMFGKSVEQLQGAPFGFPLVDGETTEIEILQGGKRSMMAEMRTAEIDWEGSRALLASLRDNTDRRILENQLRQAQKIEAVGRLAGGIAHDFNNILCVIIGRAKMLSEKHKANKQLCDELDLLYRSGERGAGLTRQLLAFSRMQILEPKVIVLNSLIESMEKMLVRLVREDISIRSRLEPNLYKVRVDPSQIEQVLMNLVINARDAMEEGGKLTIETANVELDDLYTRSHPHLSPGHYVMLAVSDTGMGMNEDTRARIFEPFFTTKELGKGTGLGLATVYGIVKQSNGHIEVYSELGKGTVFKVYLPVARGEAVSLSAEADQRPIERGHETILVAEDEKEIGNLVREFLEQFGYTVLTSNNGSKALELAKNHQGRIDLLITDIIMPEMNGPDLVRNLLQIRPEVKVIYTSGYTDLAAARNSIIDEKVSFLPKPFSPNAVLSKVQKVLRS